MKNKFMQENQLEEILARRDVLAMGSAEWEKLNREKADFLESIKPSTRERIVFFEEKDLPATPKHGWLAAKALDLAKIPAAWARRSELEYHPLRRHPIPYVLVRSGDKFFFVLREGGGGELRLIGKKGMIGGHVAEEDAVEGNLPSTMEKALRREAEEEAGITAEMITSLEPAGLIKSDTGVDADHLGLVYVMEINTRDIIGSEPEKLTGVWLTREEIVTQWESLENWAQIVVRELGIVERARDVL